MDWRRLIEEPPWWLKTSAGFAATLVLFALARTAVMIGRYGFLDYLRSTFRLDPQAWMIIGVLLLVAVASMAAFVLPGAAPWRLVP